ncbi:NADH-FMN oxidoreductase RutF, flavin reductase (DIM6/NTAB) family [Pseudoxanthomonas sp. GM95]|uniref:flavin reductase family protein n=1 Tax=Pseudoxanthomonas sp. GM95 TaxID=1881043 RepID=UPI0008BC287A|nr:flavin reductase family protein [Pseudoxanthomonas sp. GM95]SEL71022.1 NADH-FMN oxidoreductase RutF, flavin reductase (DIM6/NTAB) family [Pseudoxanthomonas sp. GM95]
MKIARKRDFPVHQVRRFLEPGPVVLVSSAHDGQRDIMTMGWHMVMEFSPSLLACVIASGNRSFELVRASRQCVINLPTEPLLDTVVRIGNCSGDEVDKFDAFGLTAQPATHVDAPLIAQCHASFECRLHDDALVERYNLFVWEVVKAHVAPTPKNPRTVHYRGEGQFMVSGNERSRRRLFKPEML